MNTLRQDHAQSWAAVLPTVLCREYPYAAGHVSTGPDDCDVTPSRLHPSFHGCFDWHSSCHMLWSAMHLLSLAPRGLQPATRQALIDLLDERLTSCKIEAEVQYLREHPLFERPYGWGWAAMLAAAAADCPAPQGESWAAATRPLYDHVAEATAGWVGRLHRPVRSGEHDNTAFGMGLVLRAADVLGDRRTREVICERAMSWFADDRDCPVGCEPSGTDFLSPALAEADLMHRILSGSDFERWLRAFLPDLERHDHPLHMPVEVADPTDGKGAHLLGLSLHRAAVLRSLTDVFDEETANRIHTRTEAEMELVGQQVVDGDFMATHWLVSFAILAATARPVNPVTRVRGRRAGWAQQ